VTARIDPELLARLPRADKERLLALLQEQERRRRHRALYTYFPDTGPLRRALYKKHLEFFRLGLKYRERALIAGNRTGKSIAGGYETALHLTGRYPHWWAGRRFDRPVDWWCAGDTRQTTRDIQQTVLLGPVSDIGSGLIPGEDIIKTRPMAGVPDAIETVQVKHQSGGISRLGMKSYDQGRKSFQGTAKQGIWVDEECPDDVYEECLMRTMTTNGLLMLTFTPLQGLTPLVMSFLPEGKLPDE
jgi:phage terminase large subunit-like protein